MHCSKIKLGDGMVAFICGGRTTTKMCAYCRKRSTALCDHILGKTLGGQDITCDAPLCDEHKFRSLTMDNVDYCPKHEQAHRGRIGAVTK